jgi:nucleotide-binding universal stress UspA family protein
MTIVVGYVPTDVGQAALTAAIGEAQRRRTDLLVVNTAVHDDYAAETFAEDKQLDAVRALLAQEQVTGTFRQPDGVDPADALLQAVRDVGAELVVVGLHRRSRVAKLILGSTAQRVLLESPCPVLAVRADTP